VSSRSHREDHLWILPKSRGCITDRDADLDKSAESAFRLWPSCPSPPLLLRYSHTEFCLPSDFLLEFSNNDARDLTPAFDGRFRSGQRLV
jgi:hypothetical protein